MHSEFVPGTRLVVSRRGYRHHGIYAGRGRVIHYAGRSRCPRGCIEEISLQEFLGKRSPHVGIAPDVLCGCAIVQRARSSVGECHYDLLSNNCEHFCAWCELGEARSPQIESLTKPVRLLLQAAVTLGPRWKRFLRREVVGKKELVARVWPDVIVGESSLRVCIAALRKVLGDGRNGMRYIAGALSEQVQNSR